MKKRNFYWCYNHENLFREWLDYIYYNIDYYDLDNATIFDLWQEAKKYALEIANSEEPIGLYNIIMIEFNTKKPYQYSLIKKFINSMLSSSENKKLESFVEIGDEAFEAYLSETKIDLNSIEKLDTKSFFDLNMAMLKCGQIESDYDYSLPDGGIKDETITKTITKTDETKTKTKTKTEEDETKTKTITKADAGTAENNETLLEELTPIFYGNKEQAEDYIKKIKNKTKDVQIVRYTAQLVNENTISEMSCRRVLYRILLDHGLYTKSESNWNQVISRLLVKKINKQL